MFPFLLAFNSSEVSDLPNGYIYKLTVSVDEHLFDSNSGDDFMLSENESSELLKDFSTAFISKNIADTVHFLHKSTSSAGPKMLGIVGSNAIGKNKFSFYFPNKKLKK